MGLQSENKRKQKRTDKYLDLTRETKNTLENEGADKTNCNWCILNGPKRLGKKTGEIGNQRKNHPNYSIVEISQNPQKRLRDPRRLAVTPTPMKS